MTTRDGLQAARTARIEELPTTTRRPARSSRRVTAAVREAVYGYLLISPWILGLLAFTAIPIIASLGLSFTNYDILHPEQTQWIGLDNYAWALSDPATVNSAFVTLKFAAVSVPLTMVVALAIAMLVNHRLLVGKRVFRTLFFLPVQIPVTASVFIWLAFLAGGNRMPISWIQSTVSSIGGTLSHLPLFSSLAAVYPIGWFTDRSWTLPWLILMSVWGVGNVTLIFLAGLQAVPAGPYEAARADGASAWRTFRHVTLPMISPMVFYNLILSLIGVAGYFTQAYLWSSNGRAGVQANVWNVNLYDIGFHQDDMGRACALAWMLFVVVIAVSVLLFWSARRWVYYAGADATDSKAAALDADTPPSEIEPSRPLAVRRLHALETDPAVETKAPPLSLARPRTRLDRFMRRLTSRIAFTVVTALVCAAFLAPFLYSLSAAFDAPNAGSRRGAPVYPAVARTYLCPDSRLCTYQPVRRNLITHKFIPDGPPVDASAQGHDPLLVYAVPGHGNLALLQDLSDYDQPSLFIDPATNTRLEVLVDTGHLSRVWDFNIALDNFATAIEWAGLIAPLGGMGAWLTNTAIIALFSTIGAVLSCMVVAYGFARFRFPGRDVLFLIMIGSVLIPYQVTLIPQFILYRTLGLTSSFLPLILPNFFGNALYIFLLRQFFLALPRDLDEAAMVDGAGPLRVLRSVLVPQALPAIAAVALFQFFFSWNDFMGPLIYLSGDSARYTLSLGVSYFTFSTPAGTNGPGILVAGSFIIMIVPVAIFFVTQRFFMRSIVVSGADR